jgi:hypothetical protein
LWEASLKSLAKAKAKRVAILAPGDVGTKIDMILLAQLKPQATATAGQEVVIPEQQLVLSRDCLADAAKGNYTKPPRQCEAIFQLGCDHVPIEVLARHVSSQLITGSVYTVAKEGGLAARRAEIAVIGKHLIFA